MSGGLDKLRVQAGEPGRPRRLESAAARHRRQMAALEQVVEPWLFGHRVPVALLFLLLSLFLGWHALQLRPDASLQKMLPVSHPFIANSLKYENELRPLGNVVRIVLENSDGDIYSKDFLETLKKVTDEVFYIPGVDRGNMKSLWTPNAVWFEVTEAGMSSGHVIPEGFDGSPGTLEQVRANVARSGAIGSLVANDQRSALIQVPLLEIDPQSGARLDYGLFSSRLDQLVRQKYASGAVRVHITGFAVLVGDLIHGGRAIALFFAATFGLTLLLLLAWTRCWRSTLCTLFCCSLAVVWQLGLVRLMGYGLDPYSTLVPFLTFAIGVSHAVQNINTMADACAAGCGRDEAARRTFRLLFVPGTVALLCDAVGFSTLLVIEIGVIRELAVGASVGVLVIVLTKMFLLPVLLSWCGVSEACQRHRVRTAKGSFRLARLLARVTEPRAARAVLAGGLLLFGAAWLVARDLRTGDLDPGAPELRADSRYNRDSAFMVAHYSTSPDVFVVMVTTPPGECGAYPAAAAVDRFQWEMENTAGVESTLSLFSVMKQLVAAGNGGSLKWAALSRDRYITNSAHKSLPTELYNNDCSMLPVLVFLSDHKAETLARVVAAAERFAAANSGQALQFRLAAGNAGAEAATNIVVGEAGPRMLLLVYAIVALLVWWEFRCWRVTLALMLPLYATSVLCEAVMVMQGLGVKVATLPVVALGVGIGVDYGIYICNRLEGLMATGLGLRDAYFETLKSTGVAVGLTALVLALGVSTWVFSEIKFQADMGLLLGFMFLWNMLGAVVMVPALLAVLSPPGGRK